MKTTAKGICAALMAADSSAPRVACNGLLTAPTPLSPRADMRAAVGADRWTARVKQTRTEPGIKIGRREEIKNSIETCLSEDEAEGGEAGQGASAATRGS